MNEIPDSSNIVFWLFGWEWLSFSNQKLIFLIRSTVEYLKAVSFTTGKTNGFFNYTIVEESRRSYNSFYSQTVKNRNKILNFTNNVLEITEKKFLLFSHS